jgi:light-regulated signal transduction histidine kinase (bacteriophytochrome)
MRGTSPTSCCATVSSSCRRRLNLRFRITDSEWSDFVSRACHDLRGPLRAIRSHAELLIKQGAAPPGSELEGSLGFIVNGSIQAGVLIDGLTDYSLALQIDQATFRPVPKGVILRAVLARMAAYLRENHAEVSYEKLPVLPGDADRLMQLFEQLLDYSVRQRGADDPRVWIAAESRSDDWLFRVRNNGPGMEAEILEKIFKPFARFHGKERPGPGLAICRTIVERHGGAMWAESAPGAGSTFCFTLPAEDS